MRVRVRVGEEDCGKPRVVREGPCEQIGEQVCQKSKLVNESTNRGLLIQENTTRW